MKELELKDFFLILYKKKWILILITILFLGMSGVMSYFILEPQYCAFTTLMVGKPQNHSEELEYSDILLNQKLVTTYGEIAKSRLVANELIKSLDLDITYENFSKSIDVTLVKDTEIIKINVIDKDPERAAEIANEISGIFIKHVIHIMNVKNIQIIDRAEAPANPVKPKPILNMIIAIVLGIILGIGSILFLEYLDNTVKSPEDIEKYLELPVLGTIPNALSDSYHR